MSGHLRDVVRISHYSCEKLMNMIQLVWLHMFPWGEDKVQYQLDFIP